MGRSGASPEPYNVSEMVFTPRLVLIAISAALVVAAISAIPTAIIANPWFTRMTPVYVDQYVYWIGTSILGGMLLATYMTGSKSIAGGAGGAGGGLLGYLAIGCPVCNKLIVALLGVSGAMDYFAPAQPFLGALGMVLLALALGYRIRSLRRADCAVRLPA